MNSDRDTPMTDTSTEQNQADATVMRCERDEVMRCSDDEVTPSPAHFLTPAPAHAAALPQPRVALAIRRAVQSDLAFVDGLQKLHSRMVGWMPTRQLEANIQQGYVLLAEETHDEVMRCSDDEVTSHRCTPSPSPPLTPAPPHPVGYCIYRDRYFKRDDCGIIYQLNVDPAKQRGLAGAALVQATFERSPYGVRLFCCWCAQDLAANSFWESLGFVPLAFRAGSRGRAQGGSRRAQRMHIFWQRRIRAGDEETPYWFPSETTGGALMESRIVLPIPPGTHWSDAKPAVLPELPRNESAEAAETAAEKRQGRRRGKRQPAVAVNPKAIARGGLRFAPTEPAPDPAAVRAAQPKRQKRKNDPRYVAAARELRDRYLEEMNARLLLPPAASGKYDVSRSLAAAPSAMRMEQAGAGEVAQLEAA